MEVLAARDQKVAVARLERGAVRPECVAGDLVHIEQTGEKIALVIIAEDPRSIVCQTARGSGAVMRQGRQQVTSLRVALDDIVRFPVEAAVDRVNEGISPAELRMFEESG